MQPVYAVICCWTLGLLPPVGYCASCSYVQISVQTSAFSSFEYTPRSGIPGSCGNFSFSFVRTGHGVFHSGCTILYCQQLCTNSIFTYILTNTSYFCLLIIAILMGKKWYLIVSFICIEHSSLCLLAICISP